MERRKYKENNLQIQGRALCPCHLHQLLSFTTARQLPQSARHRGVSRPVGTAPKASLDSGQWPLPGVSGGLTVPASWQAEQWAGWAGGTRHIRQVAPHCLEHLRTGAEMDMAGTAGKGGSQSESPGLQVTEGPVQTALTKRGLTSPWFWELLRQEGFWGWSDPVAQQCCQGLCFFPSLLST